MRIVIHHNPDCGTSRAVLGRIIAAGHRPEVVLYRDTGWTRGHLMSLLAAADLTPQAVLRRSHDLSMSLGLMQGGEVAEGVTDEALIEAMLAHPVLVNRPIVVTPRGVRLCRPPETVDMLL